MRTLVACCLLLLAGTLNAQQPDADRPGLEFSEYGDGMPAPTESMWFYLQEMKRYDDPKQLVRRNAELRAAQRRDRLAALKWLGYSKQRPQVSHTPFTAVYAPTWRAPFWDPYAWHRPHYVTPAFLDAASWAP